MTVLLGASFVPRRPVVTDEEPLAPVVPTDTERILAALLDLRAVLSTPAPVVQHVLPQPDLSAIVTAVNGLKPGADADDIARAITSRLAPAPAQADMSPVLERIGELLQSLDFRMQAPTAMIGGGILHMAPEQIDANGNIKVTTPSTIDVTDRSARLLGHVTVDAGPPLATQQTGTWAYHAGASGTLNVPAGERVLGIVAHATTAGSFTINSGDSIPVPANVGIELEPVGNLTAPTIVFTGTDTYVVETVH